MTRPSQPEALGQQLRDYFERQNAYDLPQLAVQWCYLWHKQHPEGVAWSKTDVQAHISQLLHHDDPESTRFFFEANHQARGVLLLGLLGVIDTSVHTQLLALATRALQHTDESSETTAGVLFDITSLYGFNADRGHVKQLLEQFKVWTSTPKIPFPITVLLTHQQYAKFLLAYFREDTFEEITFQRVENSQEARRVLEASGSDTLILCSKRFEDEARWVTVDWCSPAQEARWDDPHGGHRHLDNTPLLRMEPPDAFEYFLEHGKLPALPLVEHPVTTAPVQLQSLNVPNAPTAQRRLMRALTQPTLRADTPPEQRRWLADALGIQAAQSIEELLGVNLRTQSPAWIDKQKEIARRRPLNNVLCALKDDTIHAINPDPALLEKLAQVNAVIHRVDTQRNPVMNLSKAVQSWTEEDWRLDPYATDLIDGLAVDDTAALELLNARASLFDTGALKTATPKPLDDWRDALQTMLAGDAPPATLILPQHFYTQTSVDALRRWRPELVWPEVMPYELQNSGIDPHRRPGSRQHLKNQSYIEGIADEFRFPQQRVVGELLHRGETIVARLGTTSHSDSYQSNRQNWSYIVYRPQTPEEARDATLWSRLFDDRGRNCSHPVHLQASHWVSVKADEVINWNALDTMIATARWALMRALRSDEVVRLPNNHLLIFVGHGWCVDLLVGTTQHTHARRISTDIGFQVQREATLQPYFSVAYRENTGMRWEGANLYHAAPLKKLVMVEDHTVIVATWRYASTLAHQTPL